MECLPRGWAKPGKKTVQIWNWGSLLAHGSTLEIVFLIWLCWLDIEARGKTFQKYWKVVCWSLRALWEGRWPSASWNDQRYPPLSEAGKRAGKPLVGSGTNFLFCVVWRIKGDLDEYQKDQVWNI